MSKKAPAGSVATEAAEQSAPELLPPPLGEGGGRGGCSAPSSAPGPHPSLPPEGEGVKAALRAVEDGVARRAVLAPSPSGGRLGWGPPPTKPSPLAALNTHIAQATQLARQKITTSTASTASTASVPRTTAWPTLRSAQRFHETWSRISAETEVAKAEQRAPDNAGPLNSHKLVLHTLSLMRSLSPDYLRGFLAQAETLLWLEQAHALPRQQVAGRGVAAKVVRKKK